ncbi:MAG: enoyl-CoA hydratase/isomerase family protein, partial [Polyangia bacterium]
MSYSEILYEVQGATARITLNRPEKRNPLGPTTIGELLHALDCAKDDVAVRVIVLTGAGKVFSAGGDLSSMGSGGTPLQASGSESTKPGTFVDLNLAMTRVGKPTI